MINTVTDDPISVARFRRFMAVRMALSWIVSAVMVWVSIVVYLHTNLILAAVVLFAGTPIALGVIGILTMPLGILMVRQWRHTAPHRNS